MRRFLIVVLCLVGLSHCSGHVHIAGQLISPHKLAQITPGKTNREEVRKLLGSPSHRPLFDNANWYYVYKKTDTVAFFEPDVVDQKVIALAFDKDNRVNNIYLYSHEMAYNVTATLRETPATGRKLSFWEQLLSSRATLPTTSPSGP